MPSIITRALTAAVLTDTELASKLGKRGSETDLTIYDYKKNEFVLSAVVPHRFPEKLPPLLFALAMADAVVISARELSRTLAEEVVATDLVAPPGGVICVAGGVTSDQLAPLLKGSALEKYPVVNSHFEVLDFLSNPDRRYRRCDGTVVLVDQAFEVKGVGTVVLGKVHGGPVKVHQKLRVSPGGGEVQIRSIQIHDDDHPEGPVGTRVGLALRGTDSKLLPRGTVLDAGGVVATSDIVEGEFSANKFFKPAPAVGQVVHALCGLDAAPGRIESIGGGRAKLKLERPIARVSGLPVVVGSLDATGSKIVGAFR